MIEALQSLRDTFPLMINILFYAFLLLSLLLLVFGLGQNDR